MPVTWGLPSPYEGRGNTDNCRQLYSCLPLLNGVAWRVDRVPEMALPLPLRHGASRQIALRVIAAFFVYLNQHDCIGSF